MVEYIAPLFWLAAFLAEMAIYCYFGNNIMFTVFETEENPFRRFFPLYFDKMI